MVDEQAKADEGVLARWSRLKALRARRSEVDQADPAPSLPAGADTDEAQSAPLPPLDSLGPHSDYRRFLGRDVPGELRKAALRQAWRTDEAILAFRGMAEYDWDFNAPGYGAPSAADLANAIAQLVPDAPATAADLADQANAVLVGHQDSLPYPGTDTPPLPAPQPRERLADTDQPEEQPRRRHGSALPG